MNCALHTPTTYAKFFPRLRELPDPPKSLYLAGDPEFLDSDTVFLTIVGSRKASSYGKEVCGHLISGLVGQNVVIVSGLALGIDACAHQSALENNIKTIAFPGSGLSTSTLYPASHRRLALDILDAKGLVVSEFTPDTKSQKWMFPKRNRLMAGLSHAVLVIEAGEKSGTLITAYQAIDYNRDVLVVPGSIFSPTSLGNHQLLSQGAQPIYSQESLLEALNLTTQPTLLHESSSSLSTIQKEIISTLKEEPKSAHSIAQLLQKPISAVQVELTLLEIEGYIYQNEQARFVAKL